MAYSNSKLLKNYPVAWVNDVKGELDDETLKLIAAENCKLCLMHSLTIPPTKEIIIPIEKGHGCYCRVGKGLR